MSGKLSPPELAEHGAQARDGWRARARCRGLARVMDPPARKANGQDRAWAVALCRGCPVLADCQEWVLALPPRADPGGVCAAMTEVERAYARTASKRCAGCRRVLPSSEFYGDPKACDGLEARCKTCRRSCGEAA